MIEDLICWITLGYTKYEWANTTYTTWVPPSRELTFVLYILVLARFGVIVGLMKHCRGQQEDSS